MRRGIVSAIAVGLLGGCVAETVPLGALDRVEIEPTRIDFDAPGVPCGAYTQPITITNATRATLSIDRVYVEGGAASEFTVEAGFEPTEVPPGASISFLISFDAPEDGIYADRVFIEGELAMMNFRRIIPVRGLISSDNRHEDDYVQSTTGDADILFVIDNSCSMAPEQAAIGRGFSSFIQIANSGLLAYNIAITTTDVSTGDGSTEGRFVPLDPRRRNERIVSRMTLPTPLDQFEENAEVGVKGSGEERGIHAAYLALRPRLLEDHNANFLRDHALLSLIFISDEEDQSPESLEFYADHFASLKGGDRSRVKIAGAIGGVAGCNGPTGQASPATRYAELIDTFGGVVESICTSNWPDTLGKLSAVAFGLRASFRLSARADPGTVEVTVDGVPVPPRNALQRTNWRYVSRSNAVEFEPRAIPEPGAAIHIAYGTLCID
ncbi:MAG: hypothetical protein RKU31_06245 [Deltaproteobacteria bacterium]|jgi:hypothetical protein